MAIFGLGNNRADDWQKWTTDVVNNPKEADAEFRINPKGNTDIKVFNQKLAELSDEYIEQYDTNGDKKISYEEFEKYEVKKLKENLKDFDEALLEKAKKELKTFYTNLNVDNEGDSENALDKREIMNMFHTMDGSNDELLESAKDQMYIDGFVSKEEFLDFTTAASFKPISNAAAQNMIKNLPNTMKDESPEEQEATLKMIFKTYKITMILIIFY